MAKIRRFKRRILLGEADHHPECRIVIHFATRHEGYHWSIRWRRSAEACPDQCNTNQQGCRLLTARSHSWWTRSHYHWQCKKVCGRNAQAHPTLVPLKHLGRRYQPSGKGFRDNNYHSPPARLRLVIVSRPAFSCNLFHFLAVLYALSVLSLQIFQDDIV